MEKALELARANLGETSCAGAVRSDHELPHIDPRTPWGTPSGGWKKANAARRERNVRKRGG